LRKSIHRIENLCFVLQRQVPVKIRWFLKSEKYLHFKGKTSIFEIVRSF
jgi:hypothetical protein